MALQVRTVAQPNTSTRTAPTAHLATTMKLLGLNTLKLQEEISRIMEENPVLEIVEGRFCPTCGSSLPGSGLCIRCAMQTKLNGQEPLVFVSPPEDFKVHRGAFQAEDFSEDLYPVEREPLDVFIFQQIAHEIPVRDREMAAHLLSSLDDDGFLTVRPAEIAAYFHAQLYEVEDLICIIQRAEPLGVGSSGPEEALLAQVDILGNKVPNPPLIKKAIKEGMSLLSKRNYSDLGKMLDVPISKARSVAEFISNNLNPFPARSYWGDHRHVADAVTQTYQQPDVIIRTQGNQEDPQLVVEVVFPLAGRLQINPLFKQETKGQEQSQLWQNYIERANLFVKCLDQRSHALVMMMEVLAVIQRDFILNGDAHIVPITRAEIAEQIGVHESTISRAVATKSIQLPSGQIVPLSKFFDRSLHIRTEIKKMIDTEKEPLSDSDIADMLEEIGYSIARRTVSKYRKMEGILPKHMRRPQTN